MDISKNLSNRLFVAGDVALAEDTVTSVTALSDGEIAVVAESNNEGETGTISGSTRYRIIQRVGDELLKTPFFSYNDIVAKNSETTFTVGSDSVSFIGYNGSTGSIEVNNSTMYDGKIDIIATELENFCTNNQIDFNYKSDATATQLEIAKGLLASILKNDNDRYKEEQRIKAHLTSDSTIDSWGGTATIAKVTKGSKTVSFYANNNDDDTPITTSTGDVSDGDIFSIPSDNGRKFTFDTSSSITATLASDDQVSIYIGLTKYSTAFNTDAATTWDDLVTEINAGTQAYATFDDDDDADDVTFTIYPLEGQPILPPMVVVLDDDAAGNNEELPFTIATGNTTAVKYEINGDSTDGSFELDKEWEGETGYVVGGSTVTENAGIDAGASNYGIKITSDVQRYELGKYNFNVVDFNVYVNDAFGTDAVTESSGASITQGAGQSVEEMEYFAQASNGDYYRFNPTPINNFAPKHRASSLKTYKMLTLDIENSIAGVNSPYTITVVQDYKDTETVITSLKTVFGIS